MLSHVVLAIGLLLALQAPAAPRKGGSPEAAKIKNPVAATPESLAAGKRVYQRLCIRCHGAEGKGDGRQEKDEGKAGDEDAGTCRSRSRLLP